MGKVFKLSAGSDKLEKAVFDALKKLESVDGAERLVPEVGVNLVYSKPNPESTSDVVALDGRVVVSSGKPRACGDVKYGGSRFLSSVVLEAIRLDPTKRSAIVIRGGIDIAEALITMGKKILYLPPESSNYYCPVAKYLENEHSVYDAYSHPGAFGIEPTTTILAETPKELIEIIGELVHYV